MSNVVAPTVQPPQPNPFEQAVIQAATAAVKTAKPQDHQPPKKSITVTAPAPPQSTPQPPKFNAPIPGLAAGAPKPAATPGQNLNAAAGNPAQPAPAPPPGPAVDPNLQTQAAASQQQAADANKAITALLAQQPPAPMQYQQPTAPTNRGQDIGTLLGAALFPKASPAFARQANDIQKQRDKTHTEDIAAETAKVNASQNASQLATTGWNDKLTALRNQAAQGDAHAKALVDEYDREQLNAAKTREADEKLGQEATKIADNRTRFASTFSGTMAKLGFDQTKWGQQQADVLAKQAANDTYRYWKVGVSAQNAYTLAQIRAATQFVVQGQAQAGLDKRANASNTLRADLANNKDLVDGAKKAQSVLDGFTRIIQSASASPAQKQAAIAQMQAALQNPDSELSKYKAQLQQAGVYGDDVGEQQKLDIDNNLLTLGQPQATGTTVNYFGAPAPAAPAAPVAAPPVQPPAAAPHVPPGAVVGTVHLPGGQNVPGYQLNGHMFTMDNKPVQ